MFIESKEKKYVLLDIEGNSAADINQRKMTQFAALVFYNGEIEEINLMNRNINFINSYVSKMTRITVKKCKKEGVTESHMVHEIHELLSSADKIYAYGCDFDKNITKQMFEKYKLPQVETPWVDVIHDVEKYLAPTKLKLSIAASEYGFIESKFHNALTDCYATYYLMEIIDKIKEETNNG